MAYRSESLAFKINGNSLVAQRPTYEELAKKVEDLEKESLELKLAKDALREGEHRFPQLFDRMTSGVAVYEAKGYSVCL